jgi:hypothetical protein
LLDLVQNVPIKAVYNCNHSGMENKAISNKKTKKNVKIYKLRQRGKITIADKL